MRKIHKAVRPKKHYSNPTLCCTKLSDEEAHKWSRICWDKVTCQKCLAIRMRQSLTTIIDKHGNRPDTNGDKNPMAKLTTQQVDEIRELLNSGVRQKLIANEFGVSEATISLIKRGKRWGK